MAYLTREMSAIPSRGRDTGPVRLSASRRPSPVVRLGAARKPSPVVRLLPVDDLDSRINAVHARTQRCLAADNIPGALAASEEFCRLWIEKSRRQGR